MAEKKQTPVEARNEAINKARSQAKGELAVKYRDELNARIKELVKVAGFDWTPAPTEAEKREAQVRALLAEDPDLAARLAAESQG